MTTPPELAAPGKDQAPHPSLQGGVKAVFRATLALVGATMMLIGLLLLPLPLPLGAPLMIVGAVLLTRNATWARQWTVRFLARHPKIDAKLPGAVKRLLGADG